MKGVLLSLLIVTSCHLCLLVIYVQVYPFKLFRKNNQLIARSGYGDFHVGLYETYSNNLVDHGYNASHDYVPGDSFILNCSHFENHSGKYFRIISGENSQNRKANSFLTASFARCSKDVSVDEISIKHVNTIWQVLHIDPDIKILISHMYFDDRSAKLPVLRAFVVSNYLLNTTTKLYCHMKYGRLKYLIKSEVQEKKKLDRRTLEVNGTKYYQIALLCPAYYSSNEPIEYVSISAWDCANLTTKLEVIYPNDATHGKHKFGLCVPPLYGKILDSRETVALIEWIEIYRQFGVTSFDIYNVSLIYNGDFRKVVSYYEHAGLLRLHHIPPPVDHFRSDEIYDASKLTSRLVINDCMLRNRKTVKYILVVDLDDILVPYRSLNYSSILRLMNCAKTISDADVPPISRYTFMATHFFMDFGPSGQFLEDPLITSRYLYKSIRGSDWRNKAIIDPQHCTIAMNHKCVSDEHGQVTSYAEVSRELGIYHHYRRQCDQPYPSKTLVTANLTELCKLKQPSRNNVMLRFRTRLLSRVLEVIRHLGIDEVHF